MNRTLLYALLISVGLSISAGSFKPLLYQYSANGQNKRLIESKIDRSNVREEFNALLAVKVFGFCLVITGIGAIVLMKVSKNE